MNPATPELRLLRPVPSIRPKRVVVFSGHMVDAPDRPAPRFPPSKETAVSQGIAGQLNAWDIGPGDLAICGAARGGDILFAEQCSARHCEVWLFLPMPEEQFLDESVRLPGGQWEERFHALAKRPQVRRFFQADFLAPSDDDLSVHARNNLWVLQTAAALVSDSANLLALLVWDEKPTGDGPGGTSDFAERVRAAGGEVAPIINPLHLPAEAAR